MTKIEFIIAPQRAFFVNARFLAYCVAASTRPTNHASTHEWTHATTNRIDNKSVTNLCRRWHSRQPATQSRRRVKGSKVSSRWLLPSPIKQRKEKLIKKMRENEDWIFFANYHEIQICKKIQVHQIPIQLLLRTQGIEVKWKTQFIKTELKWHYHQTYRSFEWETRLKTFNLSCYKKLQI